MNKQKLTRFLQSFVAMPMFAIAAPLTGITSIPSPIVTLSQNIAVESSAITTPEDNIRKERAEKVDTFLASYDSPLEGYGSKFVEEAEEYGLDYRLLVAIAGRETTFGKNPCKNPKAPNNNFGWASCKSGFNSVDSSIEHIAKTLSGNNPKAKYYKEDMTTEQILKRYNPDSIVPGYSKQVMKIMKKISDEEIA